MDKFVIDNRTENGLGFEDMDSLISHFKASGINTSLKPFNENTQQRFKISVVFPTPKPKPSTLLKSVSKDGRVKDGLGNWAYAWKETDAFHDDENGTKEENEQAFLADTLSKAKESKLKTLKKLALEKEEAGITVSGMEIDTERGSQSRATSALSVMGRNPNATIPFEAKNSFPTANKATLVAVQDAMFNHVRTVSINHQNHYEAINVINDNVELTDEEKINSIGSFDINTGW